VWALRKCEEQRFVWYNSRLMLDLRVIFWGLVCLAFAGLAAVCLETPVAPMVLSQGGTVSSTPTGSVTVTVQPSFTPSAIPTATATPTAAASPLLSATPSSLPTAVATTVSPTPASTWSPQPTVTQLPKSAPTETRPAPPRPAQRAPHQPPVPAAIPGVSIAADIPYGVRPGAEPGQTSLDIYVPAAAWGLPVLMYVHGGGWTSGDKEAVGAKAAYFTAHGFVFVSINYRLIPAAWPAQQAADVAEAVAWVKENIGGYGGDGARVFVLGHSAGAHLTALMASDETYLREAGLGPGALRGVILLDSAAYDVEQLMRSPEGQSDTYRPVFRDDPAQWRRVSPRALVGPGKGIPPHLLLLATTGGQRRPAAEGLANSLRAAGVYAHIADACGFRNHVTINEELGRPGDPATAAVQAFLDMLLRGAPVGRGGSEVLRSRP
jgi:arylformamidase